MPNRIIKETICNSDNLDRLTAEAEVFFYRLLVQADDYGRVDARPPILLATCFPLKLDKISVTDIKEWLIELAAAEIIHMYEVKNRPYFVFIQWNKHQKIRNHRGQYPGPPDMPEMPTEHSLPNEKDIEDLIHERLAAKKIICGQPILDIQRQARVQESYVDILVTTTATKFVIEIKRGRLSNKAIAQVQKYRDYTEGEAILIGCGVAGNFNLQECVDDDIAVITYDDDLNFTLLQSNSQIKDCDFTVNNMTSQENVLKLESNLIQSNLNPIQIQSESKKRKLKTAQPKPLKTQFADFVSMTDDEHQKLVAKYGEEDTLRMIEILNNYKGSKGKKYDSDYLAILNWVVKRLDEDKTKAGLNKSPPVQEKLLCNGDDIIW